MLHWQRGEVQDYDFNRMVVEFTMLNQDKEILCAISSAAMDDLEDRPDPAQLNSPIRSFSCKCNSRRRRMFASLCVCCA
jgi:hypothetical protein